MMTHSNRTQDDECQVQDEDVRDYLSVENEQLKCEIAELKKELDELQDQFRTQDAEEFQQIQIELELANKRCRVLQCKLKRIEKRNEALEDDKLRLEECLSIAREQYYKAQELEDELSIAKEVSVRLHKELEESEELKNISEKLNDELKKQFKTIKSQLTDLYNNENIEHQSVQLSEELYNALYREYLLNEQISKMSKEINNWKEKCTEEERNRNARNESDKKLIMMHTYVCKLREVIDEKEKAIQSLMQSHYGDPYTSEKKPYNQLTRTLSVDGTSNSNGLNICMSRSLPRLDTLNGDVSSSKNEMVFEGIRVCSTNSFQENRANKTNQITADTSVQCTAETYTQSVECDMKSENELSSYKQYSERLEDFIKELGDDSMALKENHSVCSRIIESLKQEIATKSKDLRDVSDGLSNYAKLKEELEEALREAGELIISRDAALEAKDTELSELKNEFLKVENKFLSQFKIMKESFEDREKKIEKLEAENNELKHKLELADQELLYQREKELDAVRNQTAQFTELQQLKEKYHELGEKLNAEVCKLNEQIAFLNQEKESLENNLNSIRNNKIVTKKEGISHSKRPVSNEKSTSNKRTFAEKKVFKPDAKDARSGKFTKLPKAKEQTKKEVGATSRNKSNSGKRLSLASSSTLSNSFHPGLNRSLSTEDPNIMTQSLNLLSNNGSKNCVVDSSEVQPDEQSNKSSSSYFCRSIDRMLNANKIVNTTISDDDKCDSKKQNVLPGKAIANRAQNLFSKIRYRSSSRSREASEDQNEVKTNKSKLPKPSKLLLHQPNDVRNATRERRNPSLPQHDRTQIRFPRPGSLGITQENARLNSIDKQLNVGNYTEQSEENSQHVTRLLTHNASSSQVESLMNRSTSTARPLIMSNEQNV